MLVPLIPGTKNHLPCVGLMWTYRAMSITEPHTIEPRLAIANSNTQRNTVKQHYSGLVTVEHGITISKKMCEKRDNKPRNLVWINRLMTSSLSTEASFTSRTSSWTSKENRGPTNKKGSYFIIFQPALFQGSPQTFLVELPKSFRLPLTALSSSLVDDKVIKGVML